MGNQRPAKAVESTIDYLSNGNEGAVSKMAENVKSDWVDAGLTPLPPGSRYDPDDEHYHASIHEIGTLFSLRSTASKSKPPRLCTQLYSQIDTSFRSPPDSMHRIFVGYHLDRTAAYDRSRNRPQHHE